MRVISHDAMQTDELIRIKSQKLNRCCTNCFNFRFSLIAKIQRLSPQLVCDLNLQLAVIRNDFLNPPIMTSIKSLSN